MHRRVGRGDRVPRRTAAPAGLRQAGDRVDDLAWQPTVVPFERQVSRLELEGGAELVEALDVGLVEPGDRGTAIRLDPDESLDGKLAERSPQRVP